MEFWDEYEHVDNKVTYILESMKTREVEELVTEELCGCSCQNKCTIEDKCSCLSRSGATYLYTDTDKTIMQNYTLQVTDPNKPVYECNNNCRCNETICGNRLVQFGPRKGLKIVNINEIKGSALITEEVINKGCFICEYAGEILTQAESHKRYKMYADMNLRHNYIFCINENFGIQNQKTFIDPTFYGNIGRYINHSCEPNSVLIPIRIQDMIPKLCIFAKDLISRNSEITFDYGRDNNSKTRCLCNSKNCRKFLPFDNTV